MKITEADFDIIFDGILAKNRLAVFAANHFKEGVMFAYSDEIEAIKLACDVMKTPTDLSYRILRAINKQDMAMLTGICQHFETIVELKLTDSEYRDNQPSFLDTFFKQSTL